MLLSRTFAEWKNSSSKGAEGKHVGGKWSLRHRFLEVNVGVGDGSMALETPFGRSTILVFVLPTENSTALVLSVVDTILLSLLVHCVRGLLPVSSIRWCFSRSELVIRAV